MVKNGSQEEELERAQRKLGKAQRKFQAAISRQEEAREQGKQEIERARLAAAKLLAEASMRVEKRAAKITMAESRVQSIENGRQLGEQISSPEAAADALAREAENHQHDNPDTITAHRTEIAAHDS